MSQSLRLLSAFIAVAWEVLNLNRCLIFQSGFRHRFFCESICYTLKQLQNPLQKLPAAEKDTKNFFRFKSFFISNIMAERKRLMAKCQELGISVGSKTRLQVIKRRLNDLRVDWTVDSTIAPTATVNNVVSPTSPSNDIGPQQLKQIVDAVVASLQDNDVVKKSRAAPVETINYISSSSTSSEEEEEEDIYLEGNSMNCGKKRSRRMSNASGKTPSFSLAYSVSSCVKKHVLDGKFVPLFKLLPGHMSSTSGSVVSFTDEDVSIRLKAGDGMKESKLARHPLSFCQIILALLKLKDIFTTNLSSSRGLEIESYIANLCMISNKYSGLAYWNYHFYFWDKADECFKREVPLDWSVLDSEALHAAIAQSSTTNFCDLCQSWYHSPDSCPFNFMLMMHIRLPILVRWLVHR